MGEAQQEKTYIIADNAKLDKQVEVLAEFIVDKFPGEPSQDGGAIETAIRLLDSQQRTAWMDGWKRGHVAGKSDAAYDLVRLARHAEESDA